MFPPWLSAVPFAALVFVLGAVGGAPAVAAPCPTRESWPTQEWPSRVQEVAAARAGEIAALEDFTFTLTGKDEERLGIRTDAVFIVHRGRLIYERYARGHGPAKRHLAWSVSKSFTNALTGIAVGQGALKVEDSICAHLKAPAASCAVTIQDLLEFGSGFDWKESYEGESNQVSSVLAMLYGEGRKDMAGFVASHALRDTPGATFSYSSGDTNVVAGVLDQVLRPRHGEHFPWTLLFDRLGMSSAVWERDPRGVYVGASYVYATPRDYARFGYFLLNDGCWEGERVLPEGWVQWSTEVSGPTKKRRLTDDSAAVQGRQFWLNRPVPENELPLPWPDVPEGAFAAKGHWGQSITVVPSLDLVVVRVADDRDSSFDFNRFLSLAIAVAR